MYKTQEEFKRDMEAVESHIKYCRRMSDLRLSEGSYMSSISWNDTAASILRMLVIANAAAQLSNYFTTGHLDLAPDQDEHS